MANALRTEVNEAKLRRDMIQDYTVIFLAKGTCEVQTKIQPDCDVARR